VERCRDRELVVAVGYVWGERAGEVHHAVHVRFVGVVAGIIAAGKVAMRLEDLLGQRDAPDNLGRRHRTIVWLVGVRVAAPGSPRPARTHPSAPPEVEAIAPGPKSGRLHYIHGQVEVCANAKWLVRIAAEGDRIPTLLPPPAQQRV